METWREDRSECAAHYKWVPTIGTTALGHRGQRREGCTERARKGQPLVSRITALFVTEKLSLSLPLYVYIFLFLYC